MADPPGRLRRRPPVSGLPPAVEVDVAVVGGRTPVAAARLERLVRRVLSAERVRRATVSLTLLPSRAMARLNREHLGHRGATDVISFGFGDGDGRLVADVYVCPDVARRNARAHGVGVREEVARLTVHGLLHACGWDHPDGEARLASPMWARQERLLTAARDDVLGAR